MMESIQRSTGVRVKIEVQEGGVLLREQFNIGAGRFVSWKDVHAAWGKPCPVGTGVRIVEHSGATAERSYVPKAAPQTAAVAAAVPLAAAAAAPTAVAQPATEVAGAAAVVRLVLPDAAALGRRKAPQLAAKRQRSPSTEKSQQEEWLQPAPPGVAGYGGVAAAGGATSMAAGAAACETASGAASGAAVVATGEADQRQPDSNSASTAGTAAHLCAEPGCNNAFYTIEALQYHQHVLHGDAAEAAQAATPACGVGEHATPSAMPAAAPPAATQRGTRTRSSAAHHAAAPAAAAQTTTAAAAALAESVSAPTPVVGTTPDCKVHGSLLLAPPAPAPARVPAVGGSEAVRLLAAGWARKPPVQQFRFHKEVKELLLRLFYQSRGDGKQPRVNEGAAVAMCQAAFADRPHMVPKPDQVKSLFSREAASLKKGQLVARQIAQQVTAHTQATDKAVGAAVQRAAAAAEGAADSEVGTLRQKRRRRRRRNSKSRQPPTAMTHLQRRSQQPSGGTAGHGGQKQLSLVHSQCAGWLPSWYRMWHCVFSTMHLVPSSGTNRAVPPLWRRHW